MERECQGCSYGSGFTLRGYKDFDKMLVMCRFIPEMGDVRVFGTDHPSSHTGHLLAIDHRCEDGR